MSTLTYLYSLLCVTFCFFMLRALFAGMQGLLPHYLGAFANFKILIQRDGPQSNHKDFIMASFFVTETTKRAIVKCNVNSW